MISTPAYAQKMVGWYDLPQLLRTGALVAVSQQFALHGDNREIQALGAEGTKPKDYSNEVDDAGDLWIDFVADSGDGFNPTYAVAAEVARRTIPVRLETGELRDLNRGSILLFGGDLVYPTPSNPGYDDRLLNPYFDAFGREEETDDLHRPQVWALPGNHDWYDSLSCFRRLFCMDNDFGPWKSPQRLSYFAIKLPHNWSVFGIDLQLTHDLDQRQLWYFREIIKKMDANDKVILVCAEPYWLAYRPQTKTSSKYVKSLLDSLLEDLDGRLRVAMAGDLHHYQRLSTSDGRQLITCGCGGAFLHPTHAFDSTHLASSYTVEKSYPDEELSRKLTLRNLGFLKKNPWFGWAPAIAYLLVAWTTGINIGEEFGSVTLPELGRLGLSDFRSAVHVAFHSAVLSPIGILIYVIIFGGFVGFTQSKSRLFRWVAGLLHGSCHVVAGFLIFWAVVYFCISYKGLTPKSIEQYFWAAGLIFFWAWIVGSIIMGLYLWITLNFFNEHITEAFSSLRIQDWKGFVRMRVRNDGALEIYFVALDRVPRHWRRSGGTVGPKWLSNDTRSTSGSLRDFVEIKP